jgi:hypothetical protein
MQDVFLLPEHLAIVMEYCNVGDMAEYMANYMADRVRVGPVWLEVF